MLSALTQRPMDRAREHAGDRSSQCRERPVPVVALPTATAVRRLQSRSTQDLFGPEAPGAAHRSDPMHGRSVDA